jgi:hypothetical protein
MWWKGNICTEIRNICAVFVCQKSLGKERGRRIHFVLHQKKVESGSATLEGAENTQWKSDKRTRTRIYMTRDVYGDDGSQELRGAHCTEVLVSVYIVLY